MSNIRSKDTKPEILVRKMLFSKGYRYRLHVKNLPGKPDIVLRKYNAVVFVHGCFWHLHQGCRDGTIPKTRTEYWKNKLLGNKERDMNHIEKLQNLNVLSMFDNSLYGDIPSQIGSLNKLKELSLAYNLFEGEIPTGTRNTPPLACCFSVMSCST